jgi:pyruvate dehydrogenase E2 component (dihydrolipoamide acetyltransferase)
MPVEVTMPQLSDTMTEGTVVKWYKKEGDKVKEGEKIADVETDKAVMEMEAFEGGTLASIAVPEGGKVAVGATIAVLATGKERVDEVKKSSGAAPAKKAVAPPQTEMKSAAPAKTVAKAESSAADRKSGNAATATMEDAAGSEMHEPDHVGHGATRQRAQAIPALGGNGHRLLASPLARRIAEDQGIDLKSIRGTGPYGRIVQKDVLAAAENPAKPQAVPAEPASAGPSAPAALPAKILKGEKQAVPLTKIRQVIAQRLQASKQNIPHFYETVDIDIEELSALRERINTQLEKEKIRLSLGDLIAKAVAVALLRHPGVNAHYDEKNAQIIRYGDVNLGMAVALPEGLIVPVLRGIDQMGFKEIRQRSADLIDRARAQKLKQDEMTGATFTVSNLGTFGVKEFSAIINPPEVGILAIAAAEKRAVVRDGQIVARTMMAVTLSADHRAIDGAVAADFLRTLKGLLEEPGMMLV